MSKTFLRRLFMLALCACLVLLAVLPAGADFGDYSGDSDFGDSSDWSSSDSSWDSSDWDSDSYADSSDGGTLGLSFWVIGIILMVAFVTTNVGGKKKRKAGGGVSWSAAANRKLKPMSEYTQLDEAFDEPDEAGVCERFARSIVQIDISYDDGTPRLNVLTGERETLDASGEWVPEEPAEAEGTEEGSEAEAA